MERIEVGNLCVSIKGHDKGRVFLVVDVNENRAKIVDGKIRKVISPKTKNIKHLVRIEGSDLTLIAQQIQKGENTGNQRVYRAINAQINKRED